MKVLVQHTIDTYLEDILRLGAVREEDVTKGQDTLALNEQVHLIYHLHAAKLYVLPLC